MTHSISSTSTPRPIPKTKQITQRTDENGCLFLRKIGPCVHHPLEGWYVDRCLPKVFVVWCHRRPKTGLRGLFLHHDNASARTAATTVDFLTVSEVQLLPHPPYSPDLSPCGFFLVPEVKKQQKGRVPCLRAPNMHGERSRGLLKTANQPGLRSGTRHMAKCLAAEGGFFGKMEELFCLVSPINNNNENDNNEEL